MVVSNHHRHHHWLSFKWNKHVLHDCETHENRYGDFPNGIIYVLKLYCENDFSLAANTQKDSLLFSLLLLALCVCVLENHHLYLCSTSLSPKHHPNITLLNEKQVLKLLNAQYFATIHTHTQTIIKSHFNGYRFKLNALYVAFSYITTNIHSICLLSMLGFKSDFDSPIFSFFCLSFSCVWCFFLHFLNGTHLMLS